MSYYTKKQYKERKLTAKEKAYFNFFKEVKGKILDIGCSIGNFIQNNPKRIVGIDIDEDAIKICQKRGLQALQTDLDGKLPFENNSFEAANMADILAHLKNLKNALKEIKRVLQDGGFILTKGRDPRFSFWDDYTHKHPLTAKGVEMLLTDAGFNKLQVQKSIDGEFILRAWKNKKGAPSPLPEFLQTQPSIRSILRNIKNLLYGKYGY